MVTLCDVARADERHSHLGRLRWPSRHIHCLVVRNYNFHSSVWFPNCRLLQHEAHKEIPTFCLRRIVPVPYSSSICCQSELHPPGASGISKPVEVTTAKSALRISFQPVTVKKTCIRQKNAGMMALTKSKQTPLMHVYNDS